MSAEKKYQLIADQMDQTYLDDIADFYDHWRGQDSLQLKFRSIKLIAKVEGLKRLQWYYLHPLVNKRRISNSQLPSLLRELVGNCIYPLRLFQSCVEFLAPNEMRKDQNRRIIRSGFIPFENDINLEISLKTADELLQYISAPRVFYSGNKSIHVWKPVGDTTEVNAAYADRRQRREKEIRIEIFEKIAQNISFPLDRRISTDPLRVVPMPNSLNAFTGRQVRELEANSLSEIDPITLSTDTQILQLPEELKGTTRQI